MVTYLVGEHPAFNAKYVSNEDAAQKNTSCVTPLSWSSNQTKLIHNDGSQNSGYLRGYQLERDMRVSPFGCWEYYTFRSGWWTHGCMYSKNSSSCYALKNCILYCIVQFNKKINEKELEWLKGGIFPVWGNSEVILKWRKRIRSPLSIWISSKDMIILNAPFGGKFYFIIQDVRD